MFLRGLGECNTCHFSMSEYLSLTLNFGEKKNFTDKEVAVRCESMFMYVGLKCLKCI